MQGSKTGEKESTFHGINGLCDMELEWEPDMTMIKEKHAVNAMHDIIMEENSNTVLICLGPLTNLGMLLKMYPNVRDKIYEIYIMGGNRLGVGNITRAAEFNFYIDPEAAFIVFETVKCPITLIPLEAVRHSGLIPKEWRLNEIGSIDNRITRFLNPIEKKAYTKLKNWNPYDVFAVACMVSPSIIRKAQDFHLTIELNGRFTRGQVVLDHIGISPYKNVKIIEEVDIEQFKLLITNVVKEAK